MLSDFWANDPWATRGLQGPQQVVDCTSWALRDDEPIYQEGAREKVLLLSPKTAPYSFLKPLHPYLFKLSDPRYPSQFWSEIVAHRVARFLGVPVPPALVALREGEPGALLEWFYPEPGDWGRAVFIHGGDLLLARDKEYDRRRGMQAGHCHSLEAVEAVLQERRVVNWPRSLFRLLCFDVLIANGDRHHNNWGVFREVRGNSASEWFLSPAFDNGSSLGHERQEAKLPSLLANEHWFDQHARGPRARHHMRMLSRDTKGSPLPEPIRELGRRFPDLATELEQMLSVSTGPIEAALDTLCDFSVPVALSAERRLFVGRILKRRWALLGEIEHAFRATDGGAT